MRSYSSSFIILCESQQAEAKGRKKSQLTDLLITFLIQKGHIFLKEPKAKDKRIYVHNIINLSCK